jgi:hypothetical protein
MKTIKLMALLLFSLFFFNGCGPVVITSRPHHPPPPWFYPNRLEVVRYVYFPEFNIYYDLSGRTYLFLESGIWVRRSTLPPRFDGLDLRRSRYERIRDYQEDDISRFHNENYSNKGRSNINTPQGNRRVPE